MDEPNHGPLTYLKRALDEWCSEHRDACPAGKSWLEEMIIALESPGDIPRVISRCKGLLQQAEALWPDEAERISMNLPTTGSGMFCDLIGVLEQCSPPDPWPLWCAFDTDPHAETPFHGPYASEALAKVQVDALRADGYEAATRRCRQVLASECVTMPWHLDNIVDAIQDEPDGKATDAGVYVLGSFEVSWAHVRKGADWRVLDDLIEVDAFEVEPEEGDDAIRGP